LVALVVAPILENPSVENGEAGERARIEKKMRAKDLYPVLISLIACAARFFVGGSVCVRVCHADVFDIFDILRQPHLQLQC
jgi:hypothetical protein